MWQCYKVTFNEGHKLIRFDPVRLQTYLESEEDGVEELVFLVETPDLVLPHFVGQVLDDVDDSLTGDGRLIRPIRGGLV